MAQVQRRLVTPFANGGPRHVTYVARGRGDGGACLCAARTRVLRTAHVHAACLRPARAIFLTRSPSPSGPRAQAADLCVNATQAVLSLPSKEKYQLGQWREWCVSAARGLPQRARGTLPGSPAPDAPRTTPACSRLIARRWASPPAARGVGQRRCSAHMHVCDRAGVCVCVCVCVCVRASERVSGTHLPAWCIYSLSHVLPQCVCVCVCVCLCVYT